MAHIKRCGPRRRAPHMHLPTLNHHDGFHFGTHPSDMTTTYKQAANTIKQTYKIPRKFTHLRPRSLTFLFSLMNLHSKTINSLNYTTMWKTQRWGWHHWPQRITKQPDTSSINVPVKHHLFWPKLLSDSIRRLTRMRRIAFSSKTQLRLKCFSCNAEALQDMHITQFAHSA